ncbi:MAG: hypothetical protein KF764_27415 [Labilithrix sp.]|nr:hypothetical protein [Labilithrix sp.]MBX3221420.1 hypothetical protein [Labilithrix sp.]
MPIAGDRPETGVRIQIQRDKARPEPPWEYAGAAHVPDASFPVAVTVDAAGEVVVTISPAEADATAPPVDLAEKVRLIVRAVYRQAKSDGEPPAWRIVRWRGEK